MSCTDTLTKLYVTSAARGLYQNTQKTLKDVVSAGPGGAGPGGAGPGEAGPGGADGYRARTSGGINTGTHI